MPGSSPPDPAPRCSLWIFASVCPRGASQDGFIAQLQWLAEARRSAAAADGWRWLAMTHRVPQQGVPIGMRPQAQRTLGIVSFSLQGREEPCFGWRLNKALGGDLWR